MISFEKFFFIDIWYSYDQKPCPAGGFYHPSLGVPFSFHVLWLFLRLSAFTFFSFLLLEISDEAIRYQRALSPLQIILRQRVLPLSLLEVGCMQILIQKKYTLLFVVSVCKIYFLKALASFRDQFKLLEPFGLTV